MHSRPLFQSTPILLLLALAGSVAALAADTPKIVVSETVIDLGTVARGTQAVANFEIENTGSAPLELRNLGTTCACAVAEFDQVIAPGGKGRYAVKVDTSMIAGPGQAQATLGTNDPETPKVVLSVRVHSRSYLSVEPGYFRYDVYQNFPQDSTVEQTIWSNDGAEFEVTGVRSELSVGSRTMPVTASFRRAGDDERRANTPGSQWKVSFALPRDTPVGAITGWVRIDTDHERQTTAHLPITGFVRPVFAVTPLAPKYQYVQAELVKEPYIHRLHVRNFADQAIGIASLRTDVEGLELSYETEEEGRLYYVLVTATGDLPVGKYDGKLFIETDSEISGTLEVPLSFHVVAE